LFYFLVSLIYMVITALSSWLFSRLAKRYALRSSTAGRRNESANLYRCVPGYLWSDGNGSTSGLAMTAELFLLSLVPGMALAVLLAMGQVYGPRLLALAHPRLYLVFPQHAALSAADADLLRAVSVRYRPDWAGKTIGRSGCCSAMRPSAPPWRWC
jgi:MFS family permease